VIQQTVQIIALLVQNARSLAYLWTADRTNLETLSTLVAMVDKMHESLNYSFHWSQQAFVLQIVVEGTGADVCSGYMRTDGIEVDVLLWQIFSVRANEAYRTTGSGSASDHVSIASFEGRILTALQRYTPGVLRNRQ